VPGSSSTDLELLERCFDFELRLERSVAEREIELDLGVAIVDTRIPEVFSANYLLVEDPGAGAARIAAEADRVLGGLGIEHRCAAPTPAADTDALAGGFRALGWDVDTSLFMALAHPPLEGSAADVAEVDFSLVEAARRQVMLTGRWAPYLGGEAGEQMLRWDRALIAAGGGRWFAATGDGEVAAYSGLYGGGGIGQVETVGTIPAARRQGLSRAVVTAATRASVDRGDELTFIVADAEDWPRDFYRRLGFEPIGRSRAFIRPRPRTPRA
jgi:ribosomal protein S18 acetylase RimI-like enzyme